MVKDKFKSKMEWKGNYLTVGDIALGFIHSPGQGAHLVWLYLREANIKTPFDSKEQAKEAAEQAVIDWFERVLK